VAGLLLTSLATHWVKGSRDRLAKIRLESHAQRVAAGLSHQVALYRNLLYAARGSMEAQPAMDWREWRAFVDQVDIPTHYRGIKGLAFVAVVPRNNLAAYIASRTRPGMPPFKLISHGNHPELYIVQCYAPLNRNPQALGFDIASETEQRGVSDVAAITTGQFVITPPIKLPIVVPDEGPRLVFSLPVYRPGARLDSPASRAQAHLGWVSEAVWAHFLMGEVLKGEVPNISFEWATFGRDGKDIPIFDRGKDEPKGTLMDPRVIHLEEGGQIWRLTFTPTAAFDASVGRFGPHLVFAAGALISLLLFGLAQVLSSIWFRARLLAEKLAGSLWASTQLNAAQWEAMPLGAVVVDRDCRIRSWNGSAARVFGYREAHILGRDLAQTLVPNEARETFRLNWEQLKLGLGGLRAEHGGLTQGGQALPCAWYSAALRDAQGAFEGATFLVDDLTDRVRVEAALRQAQKLESLGMLAGGVAHDFNNLLTALPGDLRNGKVEGVSRSGQVKFPDRAEDITLQAARFAQQLLAYSGRGAFHVEATHLSLLVGNLADLLKAALPKKVVLKLELAEALPLVQVDSAQFQQVIMNLVLNAAEAIPDDHTGTIRIATRSITLDACDGKTILIGGPLPAGEYVTLEVEDTGCGMAPEILNQIFDPFFTTKQKGHGLGMSAILGILKAHEAGLRIKSELGHGTVFSLFLKPLTEAPTAEPLQATPSPSPEPGSQEVRTILLVEDEADIRSAACLMLTHLGYRILAAEDGLEALDHLAAHPDISLVLMDLSMPRMGGVEAFAQIQARWPHMKVILTSGYSQTPVIQGLADTHPAAFLSKPYSLGELSAVIQRALDSAKGPNGMAGEPD